MSMIKFILLVLGILLTSFNLFVILLYFNLFTVNYSVFEFLKFLFSKNSIYFLLIGIILIIYTIERWSKL